MGELVVGMFYDTVDHDWKVRGAACVCLFFLTGTPSNRSTRGCGPLYVGCVYFPFQRSMSSAWNGSFGPSTLWSSWLPWVSVISSWAHSTRKIPVGWRNFLHFCEWKYDAQSGQHDSAALEHFLENVKFLSDSSDFSYEENFIEDSSVSTLVGFFPREKSQGIACSFLLLILIVF